MLRHWLTHTLGSPVHVHPDSIWHVLEHPSPEIMPPSSHCSPAAVSIILLPQTPPPPELNVAVTPLFEFIINVHRFPLTGLHPLHSTNVEPTEAEAVKLTEVPPTL